MSAVEALLGIQGHPTYPYGQSGYEGDACRACPWQGGRNSGQAHTEQTRAEAFTAALAKHDRVTRAAALIEAADALMVIESDNREWDAVVMGFDRPRGTGARPHWLWARAKRIERGEVA